MDDIAHIDSPIGLLEIVGSEKGISKVCFSQATEVTKEIADSLQACVAQINAYFTGTLKEFDLPLCPVGTKFQQSVWSELLKVSYGKTASYLDIAKTLGDGNLTRAVGNANGKNPIAIVIPCHRIIGTNGKLTGYAGGMERKKFLLELENPPQQVSLFNS